MNVTTIVNSKFDSSLDSKTMDSIPESLVISDFLKNKFGNDFKADNYRILLNDTVTKSYSPLSEGDEIKVTEVARGGVMIPACMWDKEFNAESLQNVCIIQQLS